MSQSLEILRLICLAQVHIDRVSIRLWTRRQEQQAENPTPQPFALRYRGLIHGYGSSSHVPDDNAGKTGKIGNPTIPCSMSLN